MKENGAAAAAHPISDIEIQNNENVVQMIVAHQNFMACGIGQFDFAVVIAVTKGVAPALPLPYGPDGQSADICLHFIVSDANVQQVKSAARRFSIALPFIDSYSRPAKRAPHDAIAKNQISLKTVSGTGAYDKGLSQEISP